MFEFLRSLFFGKKIVEEETDPMKKFLIVGLGNIGNEYAETRHNVGFKILDALSCQHEFKFETGRLGDVGSFKIKGRAVTCLKPSTYMNLSGKAVKYWMEKEKVPLENLLVVTDDINLPFGTLRLKTKGSDGGHNGLKSIQNLLQTTIYNRLRFGVGSDFAKGRQVDYVLGEWSPEERSALEERIEKSMALIKSCVLSGVKNTMNEFNNT